MIPGLYALNRYHGSIPPGTVVEVFKDGTNNFGLRKLDARLLVSAIQPERLVLAIDFDGTYIKLSDKSDVPHAVNCLQLLAKKHDLIMWSMNIYADHWFNRNNIQLLSKNQHPDQYLWSCSDKCYANYYIDDRALGNRSYKTVIPSTWIGLES